MINATTKEMLYSFTHGDAVHSVIVTKDGDFIVAATYDGNIQFYSLQNEMKLTGGDFIKILLSGAWIWAMA